MIKKWIKRKSNKEVEKVKYYIIQEYQTAYNRWISIGDDTYGIDKEHGEFTACGECWQKTGVHGTFDLEYAMDLCDKLNKALADGSIYKCFERRLSSSLESFNKAKITEFRVIEVTQITTKIQIKR